MCHHAKCFRHILSEHRTHSVEALLLHNSDDTHQKYHYNHIVGRKTRPENTDLISSRFGHQQLVHYATNFTYCKPVKPQFMNLGWYDKDALSSYVSILISNKQHFIDTVWVHRYQMTKNHLRKLKLNQCSSPILPYFYLPNLVRSMHSLLQAASLILESRVRRIRLMFLYLEHHISYHHIGYLTNVVIVSGEPRQVLRLLLP